MRKYFILFALLCIALTFLTNSCTTSSYKFSKVFFYSSNDQNCTEIADNIYLFYQDENKEFKYEEIGQIDAKAGDSTTISDFEALIKYIAWENCANAIIALPVNLKDSVISNPLSTTFQSDKSLRNFSCYAVKIKQDSSFISKYGKVKDTSFKNIGKELKTKINPSRDIAKSIVKGILIPWGILFLILSIAYISSIF
jgi:hypothetical protein